jgi:prevent-host-death family protein
MSRTMSISEARAVLPEILDRVQAGEEVTITRHGKPAAVVVRPDTLRARRADEAMAVADRLREILREGRARPLSTKPTVGTARADELVADMRASRRRR